MMQAAMVDDETVVLQHMMHRLAEEFKLRNLAVGFDCFSSGDKFLSMLQDHYHYDIVFLDIEMPGLDGISVCRRIREIAHDTLVIFISNKEELVFQTFEVQPFRFIRKGQFDAQASTLADAICTELSRRTPSILKITEPLSGDVYSFDIHTIHYIEAQGKQCRIVTTNCNTLVRCRLMDLEQQLSDKGFIKPHRSYLVNCQFIFHIRKNDIVLTDQSTIPVSRGKQDEVKQQFLRYTTG